MVESIKVPIFTVAAVLGRTLEQSETNLLSLFDWIVN